MKLRTELKLAPSDWRISHQDGLIFLGSCFASEMGARLRKRHFPIQVNPFGITYHPIPLLEAALLLLKLDEPKSKKAIAESIFEHGESTGSFLYHSNMNRKTEAEFWENVQSIADSFQKAFEQARYLVLTLGTAISHSHHTLHFPVANCHRFPKNTFQEATTTANHLEKQLHAQILQLRSINPGLRILLTVSPIRHIRSGIVENGASKATLRTVSHQLSQSLPHVRYFPSYEIMLDDLRDYRFYERDLIHPNETALDYIWDAFGNVFFDAETQAINQQLDQVHRDLAHKPRDPESASHKDFLQKVEEKITALEGQVDMRKEREMLNRT